MIIPFLFLLALRAVSPSALHDALRRGDLPASSALLQAHPDVNAASASALTPLQALFSGWHDALSTWPLPQHLPSYPALFHALVSAGANTSQGCPLGPLLQAARSRNLEGMAALLASHASAPDALLRCLATPDVSGAVLLTYIARSPAPGLARILAVVRGEPPHSTAGLAAALGFESGLPPWQGGAMRKALLEASAGAPELALLQPHLHALPPPARAAALGSKTLLGQTPLDIACSAGRWRVIAWLQAQGAASGVDTCAALLAASGFDASGALPAASVSAAGQAALPPPPASPPALGAHALGLHATPPSFSRQQHAQAGWHALAPEELQSLGLPATALDAPTSAPASAPASAAQGTAMDELPLSALAPENRALLLSQYLLPGRPFIIRSGAREGGVPPPHTLLRLVGGSNTSLAIGPYPHSSEYRRGGGRMPLGEFIERHMGGRGGNATPPPYLFDSGALGGVGGGEGGGGAALGALGAMHSRRRQAVFPGPPGLSQLIMGGARTGSALHFHPPAVNFCVVGVKAWVLVPPAAAAFADATAEAWWREELPGLAAGVATTRVLQGPGDMVFVPGLWGHAVINLADSLAVAYESLF